MIKVLLNLFPYGCYYYLPLVYIMAISSIFFASFNAIVQHDVKKLIAYMSIAHMNFVVLGIFSFNEFGVMGAVLLMYAHGLVSSGLFSCVVILYERYETRQIEFFGGLLFGMPLFGSLFFLFVLGNFGFPLTLNFVGEFLILIGLVHSNLFIYFTAGFSVFMSIIYSIFFYNRIMHGNIKELINKVVDLNKLEFVYLLYPVTLILLFGIVPNKTIWTCYFEVLNYVIK